MDYPTITDEKLEEYLRVWDGLSKWQIEITLDCMQSLYTLTYGEERRTLTNEQWWRVKEWLDKLKERIGEHAP